MLTHHKHRMCVTGTTTIVPFDTGSEWGLPVEEREQQQPPSYSLPEFCPSDTVTTLLQILHDDNPIKKIRELNLSSLNRPPPPFCALF